MRRYSALLIRDTRYLILDPVLMAGIFGPLALLLLSRFGYPVAVHWVKMQYSLDLSVYTEFVAVFLLSTIPLLTGMMTGLLMLDERDENVISYYAVTPLMRRGYMVYRLFLPSVVTILFSILFILLSGIFEIHLEVLYIMVLTALEAPCFALFLAAFAANKVEGLALSKIGGFFIAGPVVAYFVPGRWQLTGAWIPSYWPAKVYFEGEGSHDLGAGGFFAAGLVVHIILLLLMVRVFLKRAD